MSTTTRNLETETTLSPKEKLPEDERSHAGGLNQLFGNIARRVSVWMGSPWAFLGAMLIIVVWALTGPFLDFSDTWQLVINTSTTIVTFLMVFLIQNSQNRDSRAIQLKLDELIRAIETAQNDLIDIEALSDEQLSELEKKFHNLRNMPQECREALAERAEQNSDH